MNKNPNPLGPPVTMPSLLESPDGRLDEYRVRYFKAEIDDVAALTELQRLETEGIRDNDNILVVDRQTNFYEGSFFVVIQYLEKIKKA